MAKKTVVIKVTDQGLKETLATAKELQKTLDNIASKNINVGGGGGGAPGKDTSKGTKKNTKATKDSTAANKEYNTSAADVYRSNRGISGTSGKAGRDMSNMAKGMGGFVHVYATIAAKAFALSAAFQVLKTSMDTSIMVKGLEEMGAASGKNLRRMAESFRDATGGAISLAESMKTVSFASSAGMGEKQLSSLAKVAKGASLALGRSLPDAVDRLTRGVVKLEPEILDELGLIVKLGPATEKYARAVGKTVGELTAMERQQAFANETIEQGIKKFGDIADKVDINVYDKLIARLSDASQVALDFINTWSGPTLEKLAASSTAIFAILMLGLRHVLIAVTDTFATGTEHPFTVFKARFAEATASAKKGSNEIISSWQRAKLAFQGSTGTSVPGATSQAKGALEGIDTKVFGKATQKNIIADSLFDDKYTRKKGNAVLMTTKTIIAKAKKLRIKKGLIEHNGIMVNIKDIKRLDARITLLNRAVKFAAKDMEVTFKVRFKAMLVYAQISFNGMQAAMGRFVVAGKAGLRALGTAASAAMAWIGWASIAFSLFSDTIMGWLEALGLVTKGGEALSTTMQKLEEDLEANNKALDSFLDKQNQEVQNAHTIAALYEIKGNRLKDFNETYSEQLRTLKDIQDLGYLDEQLNTVDKLGTALESNLDILMKFKDPQLNAAITNALEKVGLTVDGLSELKGAEGLEQFKKALEGLTPVMKNLSMQSLAINGSITAATKSISAYKDALKDLVKQFSAKTDLDKVHKTLETMIHAVFSEMSAALGNGAAALEQFNTILTQHFSNPQTLRGLGIEEEQITKLTEHTELMERLQKASDKAVKDWENSDKSWFVLSRTVKRFKQDIIEMESHLTKLAQASLKVNQSSYVYKATDAFPQLIDEEHLTRSEKLEKRSKGIFEKQREYVVELIRLEKELAGHKDTVLIGSKAAFNMAGVKKLEQTKSDAASKLADGEEKSLEIWTKIKGLILEIAETSFISYSKALRSQLELKKISAEIKGLNPYKDQAEAAATIVTLESKKLQHQKTGIKSALRYLYITEATMRAEKLGTTEHLRALNAIQMQEQALKELNDQSNQWVIAIKQIEAGYVAQTAELDKIISKQEKALSLEMELVAIVLKGRVSDRSATFENTARKEQLEQLKLLHKFKKEEARLDKIRAVSLTTSKVTISSTTELQRKAANNAGKQAKKDLAAARNRFDIESSILKMKKLQKDNETLGVEASMKKLTASVRGMLEEGPEMGPLASDLHMYEVNLLKIGQLGKDAEGKIKEILTPEQEHNRALEDKISLFDDLIKKLKEFAQEWTNTLKSMSEDKFSETVYLAGTKNKAGEDVSGQAVRYKGVPGIDDKGNLVPKKAEEGTKDPVIIASNANTLAIEENTKAINMAYGGTSNTSTTALDTTEDEYVQTSRGKRKRKAALSTSFKGSGSGNVTISGLGDLGASFETIIEQLVTLNNTSYKILGEISVIVDRPLADIIPSTVAAVVEEIKATEIVADIVPDDAATAAVKQANADSTPTANITENTAAVSDTMVKVFSDASDARDEFYLTWDDKAKLSVEKQASWLSFYGKKHKSAVMTQSGVVLAELSTMMAANKKYHDDKVKAEKDFAGDTKGYNKHIALLDRERLDSTLDGYGNMFGAVGNMMEENSEQQKAMYTLQATMQAVSMAMTMKDMVVKAGAAIANQGNGDPYTAFARIAAMAGIMAGVLGAFGGGGGGSTPTASTPAVSSQATAESPQEKADSLKTALASLEEIELKAFEQGWDVLYALRSIDSSMTELSTDIIKGMQALGGAGNFGIGDIESIFGDFFGEIIEPAFLGLFGGSTTTTELLGAGVEIVAQKLADVIDLDAGSWANLELKVWEKVKTTVTSGGFLGIGGGTETSTETKWKDFDTEAEGSFAKTLFDISIAVLNLGEDLGFARDDLIENLRDFEIAVQSIDLKDLSPEDQATAVQNALSAIANDITLKMLPAVENWRMAGEEYLEALSRVYRDMLGFKQAFSTIGLNTSDFLSATGVEDILDWQQRILKSSKGGFTDIKGFLGAMEKFSKALYSEGELAKFALDNAKDRVGTGLQELGLSAGTSVDDFRTWYESKLGTGFFDDPDKLATMIRLGEAFGDMTSSADDLKDAFGDIIGLIDELKYGELSSLTQADKYEHFKSEAERLSALAMGGDVAAGEKLAETMSSFVELSKSMFGGVGKFMLDRDWALQQLENFKVSMGFAMGGIASGGFRAFAKGGLVSQPTLGLVGEGRFNEAIVPLPDGKSIPVTQNNNPMVAELSKFREEQAELIKSSVIISSQEREEMREQLEGLKTEIIELRGSTEGFGISVERVATSIEFGRA